jgi:hypothetical protein
VVESSTRSWAAASSSVACSNLEMPTPPGGPGTPCPFFMLELDPEGCDVGDDPDHPQQQVSKRWDPKRPAIARLVGHVLIDAKEGDVGGIEVWAPSERMFA